jgi:putative hydrolases of HD superfamily
MNDDRLARQLEFVAEIDKLKHIQRQTLLMNGTRQENDAEHSWHIAVMAILLAEYAPGSKLDVLRVLKMLLVHDLVEIYAGDTFCYDDKAAADKADRETMAADRLFCMLPTDQAQDLRQLWEEFEARRTPEACFAAALDRLQPLLHNYATRGAAWKKHGVTSGKVMERNRHIGEGAPALWRYAEALIREAVSKGYLAP